jgi:dihydropteroate synthase
VKHFANDINEQGLAVDLETGEVIPCKGVVERKPTIILQARTAKELCVKLFESEQGYPITMLNHAAYLGRELVRAEIALMNGTDYIQD